ncbi:MAG: laccase domain protein [Hyphococcus sp.]|nr:MAG: laccase domain protein [Marinicaulis sp.]
MSALPRLTAPQLETPCITHGFFSRAGGVSKGIYKSLNTGPGSNDDPDHIRENRRRCAEALGVGNEHLLTAYQIHSADVVHVETLWPKKENTPSPPKSDALVTATPGIALGILTADCMPWLFVDPTNKIIGAAHAGWRGALGGILENTVSAMVRLGAKPENICAALGPSLRQENFEVGQDLVDAFTTKYASAQHFFAPGKSADKRQFDLAGFGARRLRESGVTKIDDVGQCTLGRASEYFSYRASRQQGEPDYGRNLSAIALV